MTKQNIPKVRFFGFDGEWKRELLSNIVNVNSGKDYKHLGVGEIPVYGTGGYMLSVDDYLSEIDAIGIGRKGTINKPYILKAPFWTVDTLFYCTSNKNMDLHFIYSIFQRIKWERFDESTGVPSLSKQTINQISSSIPKLAEQSQIGSLFSTIDSLLSSYKENLENCQALNKSLLSKMFPKAGQTVPEIRLDGYEGDWTFVPLNDIAEKVKEKNKNNFYSETLTNSAEFGIINQREFFDKDISNEKNLDAYYVVQNDDFIYNPRISKFAPVGPIKRNKLGRTGVMSPLYFVFRVQDVKAVNLDYLETVFSNSLWHKFMKLNGDSGARSDRFSIKDSVFITMPIPLPSIAEQQAIGSFFSNLDNLISSYQTKINELETLKKKLLQDMFI